MDGLQTLSDYEPLGRSSPNQAQAGRAPPPVGASGRTFLTSKGRVTPPVYRDLHIESVPRRVCDRRIVSNIHRGYVEIQPWGSRFAIVSVPRIRFLERAA